MRAAYLQYFLPVNLAKVRLLLDEMSAPEPVKGFSVLDIGSGPGTATLAVLGWWHQRKLPGALSVTAVDGSSRVLGQAGLLWDRYCRMAGIQEADLQTYVGNLERREWSEQVRQKGPFDLIILANCLNEIHTKGTDPIEAKTGLVVECLSLLTPAGTIMIVEPALRETSRTLHQVRDRLLQEKRCTIYSPCLHEGNCPALVKPDDWCHEERAWEPPVSIQEIDEEVGFIKDALKFSYLLLRKDGKTIVDRRSDVYRVVSELRELKGEKRAWLCNEQGRQQVGRQDRLASPQNQALDQWHRGAIVQIEKIVHKERKGKVSALGRIEHDAAVHIMRSV
ncbi:MAG TPA: small ribosomal subunit Rsm22 family protein [Nitrospira sp.]|nr:small ribosomal subunit Rsm22 family protein [Nitrospira sp.]